MALVVMAVLFYKMTWRVWRDSMKAKDEEIARIVSERDKYQALVFERLLTSKPTEVKALDTAKESRPALEDKTAAREPKTIGVPPDGPEVADERMSREADTPESTNTDGRSSVRVNGQRTHAGGAQ